MPLDRMVDPIYDALTREHDRTFLTRGGQTVELNVVDFKVESTGFAPPRVTMDAFIKIPQYIARTFVYPGRTPSCDRQAHLAIKDVIFNPPATIVLWKDGTKTVVKCGENDTYSKEHGLAMCICKKALGNKGNYNDVFKKWLKGENE